MSRIGDWINLYFIFVYPIIYILPAYVANGSPVIFKGVKPIDFGKTFKGKRIFGPHKTIRGLIFGLASGIVVGAAESLILPYMLVVGIVLSIGTHFGDLFGSFIKRRMGKESGSSVPFLDQYLFLIFALLFAYPLGNMPGIVGIIFLFILTGIMHKLTNVLANKAKLKDVPW
ncbi:MAG: CDP-2,3-bis-(O-geranylgeranyl)-sn-glycerol synthase [Candidatus Micrarchaeia archaeon]